MRRYEYEQTSHCLGDARADNGAVFVASEAVAKLSGLHYMSYDCVPVRVPASPGASLASQPYFCLLPVGGARGRAGHPEPCHEGM